MTVSAISARSGPYTANGVTVAFPFTFDAGTAAEVIVTLDEVEVSTTLYTVTLNAGGEGGTATFGTAPAAGEIHVESRPSFTQDISFQNAGPFLPETHDEAFDQAARRDIYLKDQIDRNIGVAADVEAARAEAVTAALEAEGYAQDAANYMGLAAGLSFIEGIFDTTAAGLAAVTEGQVFGVPVDAADPSAGILIYRDDAGVATPLGSFQGADLNPLVIVATGQSNMTGAGGGGTQFPVTAGVQMFNNTTRALIPLDYTPRDSMFGHNLPLTAGDNNLAFAFAHRAHRETGRPVYLIIVASGGTAIDGWKVGGAVYTALKASVEEALVLIGQSTVDVLLWHQGETKTVVGDPSIAGYTADLATVFARFRAEAWFPDDTPFIAGETTYDPEINQYIEALRGLTTDGDPYTFTVSGKGLPSINPVGSAGDRYHYSGTSLYKLGLRYWDAYRGNAAAMAFPIQSDAFSQGARDYRHIQTTPLGEAVTIDPVGDATVTNKGPAPVNVGLGGYDAGQRVDWPGASVGVVSATINADGTHTVVPSIYLAATIGGGTSDWSYQYHNHERGAQAVTELITVTGLVDNSVGEMFTLNGVNEIGVNVTVSFGDSAVEYTVDWGSGSPSTQASGVTASKTYGAAYTGPVIISYPRMAQVFGITSTAGNWSNRLSDFAVLEGMLTLDFAGTNRLHGDIADLPEGIVYVSIAGNNYVHGNLSDMPSTVTSLFLYGNSVVNAPAAAWDGAPTMTIVAMDGADRTSAQIDAIIIALAYVNAWTGGGGIALNYPGQAARTAASDAARTTIIARGGVVNTNP